jgi:hypothetical protein
VRPPQKYSSTQKWEKEKEKPWRDQELCSLAEGSLVWLSVSSIIISIAYEVKTRIPPIFLPRRRKKERRRERERCASIAKSDPK